MFRGSAYPWFVRACAALLLVPVLACSGSGSGPSSEIKQSDPLVGTWTLNLDRSKFRPALVPRSMTMTFEQTPAGLHGVSVVTLRDGTSSRNEYTAAYDGRDYPIVGVANVDTVSIRQIDTLTSERVDKRAGKRVQSYTRQVYSDGRTLVVTQKGTDATGARVDHLMIFDRK
jgi:hypothetical protein